MGMADIVTNQWFFIAYGTFFGHLHTPENKVYKKITQDIYIRANNL
jgi:hypothetical protein